MTAPRLGIAYIASFEPEGLRAAAQAAEAAGLDEFWLWEDCFEHGGLVTAATALACTERIPVGIGLLPVPLRNVALTAMELASIHRLYPGRLIAGIGHGVQDWMGQAGAKVASPMTLLTEYHHVLRRLLDGETVTFDGKYLHISDVTLRFPPRERVPLTLGGKGPKSVRLAARVGDGTLLDTGQDDTEVAAACDLIRDERSADNGHHDIYALFIAATGDNADEVADAIKRWTQLGVTSVTIQPNEDEPDLLGLIDFLGTEVKPRLQT